jgi:hypothetical protein
MGGGQRGLIGSSALREVDAKDTVARPTYQGLANLIGCQANLEWGGEKKRKSKIKTTKKRTSSLCMHAYSSG